MGKEQFGEFGLGLERVNDRALLDSHDLAFRQRRCGRDALGLSGQATFAAKLILAEDRDHSLLTVLGDNCDLDSALLDVKDGIRDASLREDRFIFAVRGNRPAFTNFGEELVGMELFYLAFHLGSSSLTQPSATARLRCPDAMAPCLMKK